MKHTTRLLLFIGAFCLNANCAIILCYSGNLACADESAWTAQLTLANRLITPIETFTGTLQPTTGISQTGGPSGYIDANVWRDGLINHPTPTPPNTPIKTTTLSYLSPAPILLWGFGANFDTSPGQGGHASGITIIINGTVITTLHNFTGGFFGVYATDAEDRFYSVVLGTTPACFDGTLSCAGWEIFNMDNLRFAVEPQITLTETPEPSTIATTLAGIVLAGLIQLKRVRG